METSIQETKPYESHCIDVIVTTQTPTKLLSVVVTSYYDTSKRVVSQCVLYTFVLQTLQADAFRFCFQLTYIKATGYAVAAGT